MEKEKRDSTFEVRWLYVALGSFFGLFALIATALLAQQHRRDKLHSALLGCAISLLLNFIYFTFLRR